MLEVVKKDGKCFFKIIVWSVLNFVFFYIIMILVFFLNIISYLLLNVRYFKYCMFCLIGEVKKNYKLDNKNYFIKVSYNYLLIFLDI